ncbi:hypothetical protein ACWGLF_18850 [Streptomyces puniciscabiei]
MSHDETSHPTLRAVLPPAPAGESASGGTLARIERPAPVVAWVVTLSLIEAAHMTGLIPPGPASTATGGVIAVGALRLLWLYCVRR